MEFGEEAIHHIYEAANEPEAWEHAARAVARTSGGGAVHLLLASSDGGPEYVNLFTRDTGDFAAEYLRDYASSDFRVPRVMSRPLGTLIDEREYVSDVEARSSAVHQKLLPRYDIHNISGANLSLDGCIGWFGISTAAPGVEFDDRQRAYLGRVSRHVLNAFRINRTQQDLMISRAVTWSSLDLVGAGLFILKSGRIVHANEAASLMVADGFFRIVEQRLCCASPEATKRLAACLKADPEHAEPVLLRHPDLDAAYEVAVHELFPRYGTGKVLRSGYRAVSITELNVPGRLDFDDVHRFCSAFGVSRAETLAVQAALNSDSLASYARSRKIGLGTAQQQLKSALAKMGLNSQKKLFRAYERHRMIGRVSS